ncbi:MAG: glycerol kinase GlpK [Acidimicrobiales bacterium]|nr:glycerol kinase GlpK [Acidimicrobiales bacterium]
MGRYVGAIDQGTTSTRFMVFDHDGGVVAQAQREHRQVFPQPGWVEHDAAEILANTTAVVSEALAGAGLEAADLVAVGITNQRETTVLWDRHTGEPVQHAVVWQDTRTADLVAHLAAGGGGAGADRWRATTGLPLATYFSGPKVAWLLEHVGGLAGRAAAGDLLAGTIDAWLAWNLTGGPEGGRHVTDVTNASRTLLMDLDTLGWDDGIAREMGVSTSLLPEIVPSVGRIGVLAGESAGPLAGVPLSGILGDQQAALFGQAAFSPGEAKNTYGTGCFMLLNTGTEAVPSGNGLLTTVAYQVAGEAPVYALEGSIAVAGALVQWLRDGLGLIGSSAEVEALARSVDDNGDVYLVPAFSGLFAPHWRSDARGLLMGLTGFSTRGHVARAALESTALQTREVLDAMRADSGVELTSLRVDGGMVVNELLMQFQADVLDVPVVRPVVEETTALGAAYAAGLAEGFWSDLDDLRERWREGGRWEPDMPAGEREHLLARWSDAVRRTLDWA